MSGDAPDGVGSTDGEIWLARSFVGFSPMGSHLATTLARRMVRRATLGAATTLLRARTWLIVWCVRCIASRFARRLMVAQPVSLLAPLSSQSPAAGLGESGDEATTPRCHSQNLPLRRGAVSLHHRRWRRATATPTSTTPLHPSMRFPHPPSRTSTPVAAPPGTPWGTCPRTPSRIGT